MLKKKIKSLKIAPVLLMIFVTGCATRSKTENNLIISKDFLVDVLEETNSLEKCCPFTLEILKDWIAQNNL